GPRVPPRVKWSSHCRRGLGQGDVTKRERGWNSRPTPPTRTLAAQLALRTTAPRRNVPMARVRGARNGRRRSTAPALRAVRAKKTRAAVLCLTGRGCRPCLRCTASASYGAKDHVYECTERAPRTPLQSKRSVAQPG